MNALYNSLQASAMGMKAQGERIKVISQNMANSDTAATSPDSDPYQRKVVIFDNYFDKKLGMELVKVDEIKQDEADFKLKYMPDHPGANEKGYVKMPNINSLIEIMDMREAQRSYEANLGVYEQSTNMYRKTIELLRV